MSFQSLLLVMLFLRSVRPFGVATTFTRTQRQVTTRRIRRFFASIDIYNEQDALKIDERELERTIDRIRSILGYDGYSMQVVLVNDETMHERNLETRGVDGPTDILSFPFLDAVKPGILERPPFDIDDYYNLGDCIVDVPYVMRKCEEDRDYYEGESENGDSEEELDEGESDSDDYDDDRGVSGAMATVYDPEKRLHMLMVHGMLHLVGYDHIEDDEYEVMVTREEDILKELGMMDEA